MDAELLLRNIAAHWLQGSMLAAAAIVAMRLLHLHEPRARLAALHLVLLAIFLLPLMQPWRAEESPLQVTPSAMAVDVSTVVSDMAAGGEPAVAPWLTPARGAVAIVAAGIGVRLSWLCYGILALARFSRRAADLPRPAAAGELEADLQVSPRYIQQTGSRGPWTFGFLRPTVALPAGFDALIPAFQRAVICHELVHVKRRDIAVAFVEELAVAVLWFHPCIWLLRARIRVAREQVVDSRVVTLLDNRDDYVRCLVDISGHDLAPHFSQAGAGMLRPRELRARVDAIFEEVHMSRMRFAVAALSFVAVTITTGLVAVAAMPLRAPYAVSGFSRTAAPTQTVPDAPRKQINKVYPEYPQDALESGIKGVVIVDITVNAAGDVTTAAVASGPQELHASAFKTALGLKYTPGSSTTAIKISVEYTLTGNAWGVRIWDSTLDGSRSGPVVFSSRGPENPMPAAARVGGPIRPPRKIKDARPVYPAIAQEARVQGVVILEARLDENGNVSHTHVLRSIPLLDQAAIDAVKQWQYEPTLLNGSATPVIMTVTVNFTLGDRIRIQLVLPDGSPVIEMGGGPTFIETPSMGRYYFKASRPPGSTDVTVSVFGEDGQAHLGDVVLAVGGPVVQSPTTPSFGLQLLEIR